MPYSNFKQHRFQNIVGSVFTEVLGAVVLCVLKCWFLISHYKSALRTLTIFDFVQGIAKVGDRSLLIIIVAA